MDGENGLLARVAYLCMVIMVVVCLMNATAGVAVAGDMEGLSPKAEIQGSDFVFQTVPEGTKVTHDFIMKNRGNAILIIEKVQTG